MKKGLLLFALVLLISSHAFAEGKKDDHAYVGGSIAWQNLMDSDLGSNDGLTDAALKASDAEFKFKGLGYGASGFAGYQWTNGFRLEGELSFFKSDIDKVSSTVGDTDLNGYLDMTALMVNALWQFESETDVFAFAGLGAGYGWAKGKYEGGGDGVTGTSSIPLVQPIFGLGYHLTEDVSMALDYKFVMGLKKLDYDELEHEYRAHRLGLGVKYDF
ncbi:MAG: porin family protein [Pseudodesulfovibrio sp.]